MVFQGSAATESVFSIEGDVLRPKKAALSSDDFESQIMLNAKPPKTPGLVIAKTHVINGIIFGQSEETLPTSGLIGSCTEV